MRVMSVHELVQDDLDRVEATLQRLKRSEVAAMEGMLDHALSAGGKRLRPTVVLLAGRFGDYRQDRLVALAAAIELLHTATLVHDDVIDASDTRHGRPTANARFENAVTVMLGDYMFANAANLICDTEDLAVVKLFSRTLIAMAAGELTQDVSAYEYSSDTMAYFHRIAGKTASLFAASAACGAMVVSAPSELVEALRSYGENLGMAFQITDDILDFVGDAAELGKPVGGDLLAGTLTLPALLLMERHPDDNPVKRLFSDKRREYLDEAISMIQNSDILDQSRAVAEDFSKRAADNLESVPDTPEKSALIDITDFVLGRRS